MTKAVDQTWATDPAQLIWVAAVMSAMVLYGLAHKKLREQGSTWPAHRTVSWFAGCLLVLVSVYGPLAQLAHHDFPVHMVVHVLLGMLAPLLLVLAAPVTLTLRALPHATARRLGRLLSGKAAGFVANPFVAAILNVGGLWLIYRSPLFELMHHNLLVGAFIQLHVLLAGYLFSYAILGGPDPAPHRRSPGERAAVMVMAIAAHNILAKSLYAMPPAGLQVADAQTGAQIMYYAGMPVEITLLIGLCLPWILGNRAKSHRRKTAGQL